MNQQKQIRIFLIEKFNETIGTTIFSKQSDKLNELISKTSGKTKNQMNTLKSTILPRVALYKALQEHYEKQPEKAWEVMRSYMINVVAAVQHKSRATMEKFPGFYKFFSKVFLCIMRTTDLQVSTQKEGRDFYDITITDCLWHNACVENGCPELCRLFCDVDDVTYGNLKKIGFSRTQTLGYGGDCCDFHFFKK